MDVVIYLTVDQVQELHERALQFGGMPGVRSGQLLAPIRQNADDYGHIRCDFVADVRGRSANPSEHPRWREGSLVSAKRRPCLGGLFARKMRAF